jgi:hypothetical protein
MRWTSRATHQRGVAILRWIAKKPALSKGERSLRFSQ